MKPKVIYNKIHIIFIQPEINFERKKKTGK